MLQAREEGAKNYLEMDKSGPERAPNKLYITVFPLLIVTLLCLQQQAKGKLILSGTNWTPSSLYVPG